MPFYIGNAQCSICKGHGFEPCPVCIGYQAGLPAPAPHEGPGSLDNLDEHLSTARWLRSFPDSRAQRICRWAVLRQNTSQLSADACCHHGRRQWCRAGLCGEGESKRLRQKTSNEVFDLQKQIPNTSTAGWRSHKLEAGPEVAEQQHWEACGGQCGVGEACQALLHPA